jgi:hypothetical protein
MPFLAALQKRNSHWHARRPFLPRFRPDHTLPTKTRSTTTCPAPRSARRCDEPGGTVTRIAAVPSNTLDTGDGPRRCPSAMTSCFLAAPQSLRAAADDSDYHAPLPASCWPRVRQRPHAKKKPKPRQHSEAHSAIISPVAEFHDGNFCTHLEPVLFVATEHYEWSLLFPASEIL